MEREDERLRRYLLGEVTEEERCQIERRLLTDRQYFNALLKAEEEMTDRYARGEISDEERESFESHFLNSAERRESVEFAADLNRYLAKENLKASRRKFLRQTSYLPRLIATLLLLAALLLATATLWLFIEGS
jgi:hypothetical protein